MYKTIHFQREYDALCTKLYTFGESRMHYVYKTIHFQREQDALCAKLYTFRESMKHCAQNNRLSESVGCTVYKTKHFLGE